MIISMESLDSVTKPPWLAVGPGLKNQDKTVDITTFLPDGFFHS